MTLVRLAGFLGFIAMVSAAPKSGERACFRIGEYRRAMDDARIAGIIDWNLDDVDAEQRRSFIARRFVEATLHLFLLAHCRGAGVVDNDLSVVARPRDHRVGMRTAAGLHSANLHRARQVADVKNPEPSKPLGTNVPAHTTEPAIEAPPRFLRRHQQQVADD